MILAVIIFLVGEAVAWVLFRGLNHWFQQNAGSVNNPSRFAVMKGCLERLFMFIGLLQGYAVVIVAFGALKLGTRLKDEQSEKISNDYFLVGNLLSMLLVLIYVWAFNQL